MSVIKEHISTLSAYDPPLEGRNPESFTLLDFNERTMPVSDPIKRALHRYIDSDRLHIYPSYGDIIDRLARYVGINSDQIMITNGSDQGIDLIFRSVSALGAEAIIPSPSFSMYYQCAKIEAMKLIEPQYTRKEGYPINEVLAAITPKTKIIVISNPNNPCGTMVSNEFIKKIAIAVPYAAILVDECYFEYTQKTVVSAINDYSNLFITRTFSKTWGIPSLRFGYLIASSRNILSLCNVRGPYDINQLAIVAANTALDYPEHTKIYVSEVMGEAKPLVEKWLNANSIEYWPSQANYIWCFPEEADKVGKHLYHNGFLIRRKAYRNRLGLRVTIGTVNQMQSLINAWKSFF